MAMISDCRRGVVLPRACSNSDLNEDGLWIDQVEEAVDLNTPGLFETLWVLGLFSSINAACGSFLDDYDEDEIRPAQLSGLIRALRSKRRVFRGETQETVERILAIAERAKSLNRSVHFVL
jgi:hypothetical protein